MLSISRMLSAILGGHTPVLMASARMWSRSLTSLYGQTWMIWLSVPTSVRQKPPKRDSLVRAGMPAPNSSSTLGMLPGFMR